MLYTTNNMSIGERFKICAVQLFEEIQQMLQDQPKDKMLLQLVIPQQQDLHIYSGLCALLKTAQLENPNFTGQIIELDTTDRSQTDIESLLEANSHYPKDHWIRYQDGERYVAGWSEVESSPMDFSIPWTDRGVYLITGGAGELGLLFAKEIACKVKEGTVILAGRSLLNEKKEASLHEIEQMGVRVLYRQVDVADETGVVHLVRSIHEEFGGLQGIIHSAGIIRDNFIIRKTREQFMEVLAPKVNGLINLDHATTAMELDFFIIFSSTAGILGNPGQADYAAANSFMDAYAKYRNGLVAHNQRKGHTLSINWPLWKEGGMQIDHRLEELIEQNTGMLSLDTAAGIHAFYQSMASGRDQVAVIKGDVTRVQGTAGSGEAETVPEVPLGAEAGPYDQAVLSEADNRLEEQGAMYIKKLLSSVIKLPPARIQTGIPFEQYGMDSIMVIQMTNQLEQVFGSLPKTLFFEYQNIADLTAYLLQVYPDRLKEKLGGADKASDQAAEQSEQAEGTVAAVSSSADQVPQRERAWLVEQPLDEQQRGDVDIAIIGVAGRYPGASNIREFWDNLQTGRDSITEIPASRWDYEQYQTSRWGGFVDGVDQFDPLFFSISPREAELMDPQERLFLQCVYETLEDAGYALRTAVGTNGSRALDAVGVFVGVMYEEYQLYGAQEQVKGRMVTLSGNPSSIANRVSYAFDFHGPSMAIDTMCSSSITAIHLACRSILSGDCEMAIAGGVNVSVHPNKYLALGHSHFSSSKGRCESFGEGGDGYVPGEGVGSILLKPLSKATADGDHIYGVIKGSAVNHGGKTNGYTVPNPNAQAEVIEKVLKKAGVDPRTISYIEAHGTGTSLGDPIEIAGLTKAFGAYTQDKQYCAIGSVKSNIGHGESSAGIAGLTKVLLQMKYRQLVPSLHSKVLNPHIDFGSTPFIVQQNLAEWPRPLLEVNGEIKEFPRIAGISSFGAGGSNAHLLIEEYIAEQAVARRSAPVTETTALIVLSAKNKEQLRGRVERLVTALREWGLMDEDLPSIAYTLQTGRESMEERMAIHADSVKELEAHLLAYLHDEESADQVFLGQAKLIQSGLDGYGNDEDMAETIAAWIQKKKYRKLLKMWVNGLHVDWSLLYGASPPRRIPLPTYPFAKNRYWITRSEDQQPAAELQPSYPAPIALESTLFPQRSLLSAGKAVEMSSDQTDKPSGIALTSVANAVELASTQRNLPDDLPGKSAAVIRKELASSLATALYVESSQVDPDHKFIDIGMDSIIGVEWIRTLNKTYGTALPAAVIYDYPTIRQLAGLLLKELKQAKLPVQEVLNSTAARGGNPEQTTEHSLPVRRPEAVKVVREELTSSLAQALYLNPVEIELDHKFIDMGMDSVIGVEWVRTINQTFGTALPASVIYDYPSIRELAQFTAGQWRPGTGEHSVKTKDIENRSPRQTVLKPVVSAREEQSVGRSEQQAEAPVQPIRRDAVAIVGISGRYPGAADLDQYWKNLVLGKNSVREIPPERWDVNRYREGQNPMYCKWLGALEDIEFFDPLFFNISPSEAELIDPQQRIFLQEAYKAFEDAGYGPEELNNQKCGVYLGMMGNEYIRRIGSSKGGISSTTGNSAAIAAARIPYFLNLKGPAISIDTACSSSLVAAHLASQALLNREVNIALVGGVTLYLSPESYLDMCSAGMLSPDGQCKSFDNSANGFVPGEGAGALVLKRLEDAETDHDHIYGVIIGSGMNQDGKTNGITAPSMNSQMELVREIYQKYDISPDTIAYAEMHGTGTKLGDPIELEALSKVFEEQTDDKQFCAIGSVKSNIGHTSAAAGAASMHKVLMCLKHKLMVPTLHFNEPNEHFHFENSPFYANTEVKPLLGKSMAPVRCCVSAFGYSGTNAHLVIEEYRRPDRLRKPDDAESGQPVLVVLSAQSEEQLIRYTQEMKSWIETNRAVDLQDFAYTLQVGRGAMDYRLAFSAHTAQDVVKGFDDFIQGRPAARLWKAKVGKQYMDVFETDDEAQYTLQQWLHTGRLDQAAEIWVKGQTIRWNSLYGSEKPNRLSLPTYPFAKERCWIADDLIQSSHHQGVPDAAAFLHPLLHRNVSDFSGTQFRSAFTGTEFFLMDHMVLGEKVLSGAACLVMVRAAIHEAADQSHRAEIMVRLKDIVWHCPLAFKGTLLEVYIGLVPTGRDSMSFEIYSKSGKDSSSKSVVYCNGSAELTAKVGNPSLDLEALRSQCTYAELASSECYETFREMGIDYGASHQGIEKIYIGRDQVTAKLALNSSTGHVQDGLLLHPGLLDSAFQAAIGLVYGADNLKLSVPFAVQTVDILRETSPSCMWAWIRYSRDEAREDKSQTLDIDICDEDGLVCVRMKGLSTWVLESQSSIDASETEFYIQLSKQVLEGDWTQEEVEQILQSRIKVGGAYD